MGYFSTSSTSQNQCKRAPEICLLLAAVFFVSRQLVRAAVSIKFFSEHEQCLLQRSIIS